MMLNQQKMQICLKQHQKCTFSAPLKLLVQNRCHNDAGTKIHKCIIGIPCNLPELQQEFSFITKPFFLKLVQLGISVGGGHRVSSKGVSRRNYQYCKVRWCIHCIIYQQVYVLMDIHSHIYLLINDTANTIALYSTTVKCDVVGCIIYQ